jgi:hypothetical protein
MDTPSRESCTANVDGTVVAVVLLLSDSGLVVGVATLVASGYCSCCRGAATGSFAVVVIIIVFAVSLLLLLLPRANGLR